MKTSIVARVKLGMMTACLLFVPRQAHATDPEKVEWSKDWPRIRVVEAANIAAVTIGSIAINSYWNPNHNDNFHGGILFDDAVRSALRGRSASTQSNWIDVGDNLYKGAVLAPYIIDAWIVALGIHQSADVAIEMTLINMQSLGLTGVTALAVERSAGRARPYTDQCQPDGTTRDSQGRPGTNTCGSGGDFQSFFSGHAAATATMAGLTCVHHQHLPLYGGGFADLAPCLFMIGVSGVTGVSRVVGDRHFATDVITGWGVGALSGYVLPSLLHYGFTGGHALGEIKGQGMAAVPVPSVFNGGAGLGLAGVF